MSTSVLTVHSGSKLALSPKRPLASLDENAIAFTKRVKSITSCEGKCDSTSTSTFSAAAAPKFFLVTDENATVNAKSKSLSSNATPCTRPEKASTSRPALTIRNATSTSSASASASGNGTTYSFTAKGSDGGVVVRRKKASGSSPIRDGARGVKRTHARFEELKVRKAQNGNNNSNSSNVRRVDPPSLSSSKSGNGDAPISIDEILASSKDSSSKSSSNNASAKGRSIAYPVSPQSRRSATTVAQKSRAAPLFPDSWMFKIHEDTEEETLTNIVDFHTGNLDISDDEDKGRVLSELELKGKENIPPADHEEIAVTPSVIDADTIAMPPPPQPAAEKPVDHKAANANKPRSPLSTISTSDLYPTSSSESSPEKSSSAPVTKRPSRLSESESAEDLEQEEVKVLEDKDCKEDSPMAESTA